ncbi:MAG: coenzyme F420-0:L-glutamate ligase [Anaerolineae bacterium]
MPSRSLTIIPIKAPVQQAAFDLPATIVESLSHSGETLQAGDILAVSSKYTAISEGRVVKLSDVEVGPQAAALAERYHVNPQMAELVVEESDHILGGIHGFLLTAHHGIIQVNAGLDRSNIPAGYVVLLPKQPYHAAAAIRAALRERLGVDIGIILTDSWLMPGRLGSVGVALATAGFRPVQDERGKVDLFGNAMSVTQRGIADAICTCAQMVMGERDEATPLVIVRHTGVQLEDIDLTAADVSLDWQQDIYVESLTRGVVGG